MKFKELHCSAHCTRDILSPQELQDLIDIWAEHVRERATVLVDWSVVLQRLNLKFPRARLTLRQIFCALNGKAKEMNAAIE